MRITPPAGLSPRMLGTNRPSSLPGQFGATTCVSFADSGAYDIVAVGTQENAFKEVRNPRPPAFHARAARRERPRPPLGRGQPGKNQEVTVEMTSTKQSDMDDDEKVETATTEISLDAKGDTQQAKRLRRARIFIICLSEHHSKGRERIRGFGPR